MLISTSHKIAATTARAATKTPTSTTLATLVPAPSDSVTFSSQPLSFGKRAAAHAPAVGTLLGCAAGVGLALSFGTSDALLSWPVYSALAGRIAGREISYRLDPSTQTSGSNVAGCLGMAAGIGYALGSDKSIFGLSLVGYTLGRELGHLIAEA